MLGMPEKTTATTNLFGLNSASFTSLNDDTFICILKLVFFFPLSHYTALHVGSLAEKLPLMVKDFNLNLDSLQRFRRILP